MPAVQLCGPRSAGAGYGDRAPSVPHAHARQLGVDGMHAGLRARQQVCAAAGAQGDGKRVGAKERPSVALILGAGRHQRRQRGSQLGAGSRGLGVLSP